MDNGIQKYESFNPCFSGRYSATKRERLNKCLTQKVSILVLVEGTLQPYEEEEDKINNKFQSLF